MDASRKELGDQGEQWALDHLRSQGLELLERNFRCAGGEIDLIMRDGVVLALTEVRLRQDRSFGGAAASVTALKQRRLVVAAQRLMQQRPAYRGYRVRFDLVAIETTPARRIEWIKDAFRL
jgi:putative endonuclease